MITIFYIAMLFIFLLFRIVIFQIKANSTETKLWYFIPYALFILSVFYLVFNADFKDYYPYFIYLNIAFLVIYADLITKFSVETWKNYRKLL